MGNPKDLRLVASQPAMTPAKVISGYSADEWEVFVDEWAEGFDPPYAQVVRLGGPGDKGRDVIGYVDDPMTPAAA